MKCRPRKIIKRVLVLLLLGAIVNVAVAWACALSSDNLFAMHPADEDDCAYWQKNRPNGYTEQCLAVGSQNQAGVFNVLLEGEQVDAGGVKVVEHCNRLKCGWPMYALEGSVWARILPASRQIDLHSMIVLPEWRFVATRYLPSGPRLIGFAINTIFYAVILWSFFAASGGVHRWWRIRRGLCPACAYPIGTSNVCTECGRPIPAPPGG